MYTIPLQCIASTTIPLELKCSVGGVTAVIKCSTYLSMTVLIKKEYITVVPIICTYGRILDLYVRTHAGYSFVASLRLCKLRTAVPCLTFHIEEQQPSLILKFHIFFLLGF